MFSNCSGPCESCYTGTHGGCLAGNADDDYVFDPDVVIPPRKRPTLDDYHRSFTIKKTELFECSYTHGSREFNNANRIMKGE